MALYSEMIEFPDTHESRYFDFGLRDKRGRVLGAFVSTGVCEFVDRDDDENYGRWAHVPPGLYFFFRPSAARSKRSFGAYQSQRFFRTFEEREAAIVKYLESAKKRAQKLAATSIN